MSYQNTDVYRYLIYLQEYLLGDLEVFHRIASEAEIKEDALSKQSTNRGCLSFSRQPITTSTTTSQTTQYPYSFAAMFGKSIISRLTIPNAAALFSTIDILGFLTRTGHDYTTTHKNVTEFFAHPSTNLNSGELSVLLNVYRHGMTHNYFPKLNVEISYRSDNPPEKLFFKSRSGGLILNVNRLESLTVNRLDEIIRDISLYPHMDSQFSIMVADYALKSGSSITTLLSTL